MTEAGSTHHLEGPTNWVSLALELALALSGRETFADVVRSLLRGLCGASEIAAARAHVWRRTEVFEALVLVEGAAHSPLGPHPASESSTSDSLIDPVRFQTHLEGVRVHIAGLGCIDLFTSGTKSPLEGLEVVRPVFRRLGEMALHTDMHAVTSAEEDPLHVETKLIDAVPMAGASRGSDGSPSSIAAVQQLVARISGSLSSMERGRMGRVPLEALAALGQCVSADRVYVVEFDDEEPRQGNEWCAAGVSSRGDELTSFSLDAFPYLAAHLREQGRLYVSHPSELPEDATHERDMLQRGGVTAAYFASMMAEGRLRGFVSVENLRDDSLSPSVFVPLLQLFANVLSADFTAWRQQQVQASLHEQLSRKAEEQHAMLVLSDQFARAESQRELFTRLRESLRLVTGLERMELTELTPDKERFRIYTLEQLSLVGRPRGEEAQIPNALEEYTLACSSVEEALRLGQPVTSRERAIERFHDWSRRQSEQGHQHFLTVPLVSSSSHFATLAISFARSEPVTVDEVEALAQLGSLLAAHLSMHEAREDLRRWNSELEVRDERRTRDLLETEQLSENLFIQAPQAMLLLDERGRILNANHKAQSLFGYSDSEFQQLTLLHLVPAAQGVDDDGSRSKLERALQSPDVAPSGIIRFKKRNHLEFAAELGVVTLQVGATVQRVLGITDVSGRVAAQQAVTRSLREKETLLKEIHHRVKNNLQIISSLLVLQSDQMPTPRAKELLEESVYRIRSMALIHEQLYGVESLERIDLGDYARLLTESLRSAFAPYARVKVEADVVEVNVELAVPLGLILNELITNAFKYGLVKGVVRTVDTSRRTGAECDVIVEVGLEDDLIRLAVTDSGPGVPSDFDPDRSSTLGLQLIRSLNRQLRGQMKVDSDRGARFVVTCTHPGMALTQRLSVKDLAARAKAQQASR